MNFTPQQLNAIGGKGNALLVSAAAGSGKTAVLVERVLQYLTAEGGDIRRLIIMTFTDAAAAEMRMKIKKAVDQYLREQGGGEHLLLQSTLIDSAQIGTIHSICLGLITRHFEQLDLDPRLRIIDETDEEAMLEEQMEELIEELYGNPDPKMQHFMECFATGRDDRKLQELLSAGMTFLEKQPFQDAFIQRALTPYRRTEEGLFACFAEDGLYRYLRQKLHELMAQGEFYLRQVTTHPYMKNYPRLVELARGDGEGLSPALDALEMRDYEQFRHALSKISFATANWKALTEGDNNEEFKTIFSDGYRKKFKDAVQKFIKKFCYPEEQELAFIAEEGALLETYLGLCRELGRRMRVARRRGGWISYQDMEQMAVELLVESYDPQADRLVPTALALQLRQDYDEIIIDEFQDTNRAQDLIFRALSKEEKNLFMVGDLKQSIYRFRGADSEIFDQKRQQSAPFTQEALGQKTVLELNANFRSHPGILRFSNRIFEGIMSPELGGVVYDERERLNAGQAFLEQDSCQAELHWLEPPADEATTAQQMKQNARYAANYIAKAVAEKQEILLPGEGRRPVEYGDFAILLRGVAFTAPVFERALREAGIPVTNRNEGDRFFDLPEVQSILSYLLVLNNPYDDVALVTLLYGDYFRFTVGELAGMRHRHTPLYEDLKKAAQTNEKAKAAVERIEDYRKQAGSLYVYDLLYRIYQQSGIFGAYAATEGGAEKCANLELLAEDARLFEREGYRGLYAFVQHIRISRKRTQSGARLKNESNSVEIMSIHKSKGLQFPVCILGDCQKAFSDQDIKGKVLLHSRYGVAMEHPLPKQYYKFKPLSKSVLEEQIFAGGVSEEERIFYVAVTRAVSKVVLLCNAEEKTIHEWVNAGIQFGKILPPWILKTRRSSYAQWMMLLLAGSKEGEPLRKRLGFLPRPDAPALHATLTMAKAQEQERMKVQGAQKKQDFDREAFRQRLDWVYPHLKQVGIPAKLSVSELKGMREAEEDAQPLFEQKLKGAVPSFAAQNRLRGNEIGNALHQALQFCDFARLRENPEEELARLVNQGFILEKQREMIPVEKLERFTKSDCFEALMSADAYYKEERFLFPMEAKELFGEEAQGEVLIQGVLDCYWVKDGKAVILDYKTDRVRDPQELIARYQIQMELYEQALKRVRNLAVLRREIYSFSLEKTIVL